MRTTLRHLTFLLAFAVAAIVPVAATIAGTFESNLDRAGGDYRSFDLEPSIAGYGPCESICLSEAQCKAWTFVRPGIQGPKARCWLKNVIPPGTANNCCVSGVKTKPIKTIGKARTGGAFVNKILEYANSKLGSKVGRGECTDLVSGALAYAGAPAGNFSSSNGHYTWGKRINFPSEAARPGDIVQLVNVKLSFKTANSWGSWETGTQHSAVIVSAEGKLLHVIDQNAPPGSPVGRNDIHLDWTLERGDYAIFRP
jgi:hypothetical protein